MGWLGWLTVPVAPKETENSRDRDVTLCIRVFTKLREEKKGKVTIFYCGNPDLAGVVKGSLQSLPSNSERKSSESLYFPLY